MNVSDINERILAKSELFTGEEMKFARVHLNLPSAGGKNSTTRNWFRSLSRNNHERLLSSVDKKIEKIVLKTKGSGN